MSVLIAEGLHTFYGKSHILHGVGLTVGEGEIVTLLGRNGAGKSTTLRSLMGLTPARQGSVRIFGQATTAWPPDRIACLGVGFVPEGRRVFGSLTVEENLLVPIERPGPWNLKSVYQLFPRLQERRSSKGRFLSGGEQEMLAIARALLLNPKLLLLDEPSQGLAPLLVREVFNVIVRDAPGGHLDPAGRAERAHGGRDRGSRLRARRWPRGLRGTGRRVRPRRGAGARAGRRQLEGMGSALLRPG